MNADYGIFTDLVKATGFLISATAAISLTWKGRAKWEPSEEDIPKAPQKVAGLASAVALAFLWSFAADNGHLSLLGSVATWSIGFCIGALIVYGYLIAVQTYSGETPPPEPDKEPPVPKKLIGGFWLLPNVKRLVNKKTDPITVQEHLDKCQHNPDKVWSRPSRGLAKTLFVVCYLVLTVAGTVALTSAAMLTLYRNPPPPPVDKKTVQFGIVLTGQIYFTREIMSSFTTELDKLLAPTAYAANYEFVVANPDASKEAECKASFEELLAKFPSNKVDYLVTIGTQASEFAKRNYADRFPIVFIGVTDPLRSGLVKHFEADESRGNIAGVIYGLPTTLYLQFYQKAFPGLRFGFVFNKNFAQDVYLRDDVLRVASKLVPPLSVTAIEVTEPLLTPQQQDLADIFFGRYFVAANLDAFVKNSKKPFVAGDISNITKGAIACIAPSSNELGVRAARDVVAPNLLQGVPLWQVKISGPTEPQTAVNMTAARRYGVQIAKETISQATRRVE